VSVNPGTTLLAPFARVLAGTGTIWITTGTSYRHHTRRCVTLRRDRSQVSAAFPMRGHADDSARDHADEGHTHAQFLALTIW
jgi:hypothetical protein